MNTATIYALHGFLGSGKTTFAKKLETSLPAFRITHDEWMIALHGNNPPEAMFAEYYNRVIDLAWKTTERLVHLNQDVILDFGFWTKQSREELQVKCTNMECDLKLYNIALTREIMFERVINRSKKPDENSFIIDENAFNNMWQMFEPISDDENFLLPDL